MYTGSSVHIVHICRYRSETVSSRRSVIVLCVCVYTANSCGSCSHIYTGGECLCSCVCPSEKGCVWRSGVVKTSYVSTERRPLGLSCSSVKYTAEKLSKHAAYPTAPPQLCIAEKLSKHAADPTAPPHLCTCLHDIPMLSVVHFQDTSVSHDSNVTNEAHLRT